MTTQAVITLEFYWDDLTPECQKRVIEMLGEKPNWEYSPFCTMEIEEDEQ